MGILMLLYTNKDNYTRGTSENEKMDICGFPGRLPDFDRLQPIRKRGVASGQ